MLIGLQLALFLGFPFFAAYLRGKRIRLSPIVASYIVGIAIGNSFPNYLDAELSMTLTEASVLLSIPLLLFSSNIKSALKEGKTMLPAFVIACIATVSGVLIAYFATGEIQDKSTIAGMVSGVYTGGTTNLNAIGLALEAPEELFIVLNTFDTVFSGIYLLLILAGLPAFLSFFLKKEDHHDPSWEKATQEKLRLKEVGLAHGYAIIAIGISIGITFLITTKLDGTWIIILLSALAVAGTLLKPIQKLKASSSIADYWLQVFAIAMGSMARIDAIDWSDLAVLQFIGIVFGAMLLLYYLLSRLIKTDVDTALVASTAAVFGPPFVGLVAAKLKAERLILPGIAVAILGNAFGTYLGLILSRLL